MSEQELVDKTAELETKVNLLVESYIQARERIYYLEKENHQLQDTIKNLAEEAENFQKQQKNTNIVDNSEEKNESLEQLKKQVNAYIKLIDKCIAQLDS